MTDAHDETPLMPGIAPAPQRDPDWVTKHGGPIDGRRQACGESGCICYGVGPGHADCACGCDCPPDPDDEDWEPGTCDNCPGGDENGITAAGALGFPYCACAIGKGADPDDCRCGPAAGSED